MRKCPYCAEIIQPEAIKCRHCGEMLSAEAKKMQAFKSSPNCIIVSHPDKKKYTIIASVLAAFMLVCLVLLFTEMPKPNPLWGILAFVFLLVTALFASKIRPAIKCPCGYNGEPNEQGGSVGCLLVLLLFLGVIPGILYLLFVGESRKTCPKCGREAG